MSTISEQERATMLQLLDYPNPEGLHPNEARWRDFARIQVQLRETRIRQLETLNRTLSEQVDRMRPIVEAAQLAKRNGIISANSGFTVSKIYHAVDTYEHQLAGLMKEGE
jgi:hypothetical protein